MDQTSDSYEVVVIGGGAAGLAGAVALLRSRRSVLLVDAGDPRNAPAGHVHNFLTQDGTAPDVLYAAGRTEVQAYGGQILHGDVDTLERDDDLFRIQVQDRKVTARRVLVATGARDELPDIAGLAERWGIDVLHCPYCHGWEVRDQHIGVLATGPLAVHQALMFRQLSAQVTLLQHTGPPADTRAARTTRSPAHPRSHRNRRRGRLRRRWAGRYSIRRRQPRQTGRTRRGAGLPGPRRTAGSSRRRAE